MAQSQRIDSVEIVCLLNGLDFLVFRCRLLGLSAVIAIRTFFDRAFLY